MKKRTFHLLISFLLLGCLSADPRVTIQPIDIKNVSWFWTDSVTLNANSLSIQLAISKRESDLIESIAKHFIVDGSEVAIQMLTDNYDVALLQITNNSDKEIIFELSKLIVYFNDKKFTPIHPSNLPKDIESLNIKGATKNLYNIIAIIVIITAISAMMILFVKGGSSIYLRSNPNVMSVQENEKKLESYDIWSEIIHKTNYTYQDLIVESNRIQKGTSKQGIIFFRKGLHKNRKSIHLQYN